MFTTIVSIIGTAAFAAIGWIFQKGIAVSTRVSVIETRQEDLPDLINARFADVSRRLDRIERAMNGALKGHELGDN